MDYIVTSEYENIRLDKVITLLNKEVSRTSIQRLLEEEKITVNEKKVKASYKVMQGDKIYIEEQKPKETELKPQEIPLEVLYEDKDIIVINKQKGMVVHPRKWKSGRYFSKCYYGFV